MQYLLDTDEPVPLSLPNQWLWDIIDEFIYQVRSFPPERKFLLLIKCEVHNKLSSREEISLTDQV